MDSEQIRDKVTDRYADLSDEQLVVLYRSGDGEAGDALLEKYKPFVRHLTRARYLAGGDRDDLIQEGMIGLYKAIRDFEPDRDAKFITFAGLCINRQMIKAIESSTRMKNQPLNESVELTEEEIGGSSAPAYPLNPESILIEQERTDERMEKIFINLSPMEREVLQLFLDGMGYREIAQSLDRTPKQIDNAIQRIRKKARKVLQEQ